ncbi:PA14 domain-containing protein, partial [Lacticaseibacillus paracasei]|nr:PA14 domain-containing protein [Lacticaseibacillus paracasei]
MAQTSGIYTVKVNEMNDGGFIWLGKGAFDPCSQALESNTYDDVLLGVRSDDAHSSYVFLEAGVYYPIRVVYVNVELDAQMQFQIIDPDGTIDDFQDIYNFPVSDMAACAAVTAGMSFSVSTSVVIGASTASTEYNAMITNGASGPSTYFEEIIYLPSPNTTYYVTSTGTAETTYTSTSLSLASDGYSAVVVVVDGVTGTVSQTATENTSVTSRGDNTLTGVNQATGCSLEPHYFSTANGFHATFYDYGIGNVFDKKYYANSYTTEHVIGTAHSVTNPNYSVGWGQQVIYSKATIDAGGGYVNQLTGYFRPKTSGLHVFKIKNVNDGAMVWFGNNDAFACCQPDDIPYDSQNGALFFTTGDDVTAYVHFDAGKYYPMRVVLVNMLLSSVLDIEVITPDVVLSSDWSDYVISITDIQDGACPGPFLETTDFEISSGLTQPSTSYYKTDTVVGGTTTTQFVTSVDYPTPSSTIATTITWSNTYTSSISSASFSWDDTTTTPYEIVTVYVPSSVQPSGSNTNTATGSNTATGTNTGSNTATGTNTGSN